MASSDRTVVVHVRKTAWVVFGVLLLAPWVALVLMLRTRSAASALPTAGARPGAPSPAAAAAVAAVDSELTHAQPGPWGDLEYFSVLIEPPEQLIVADYTQPGVLRWVFRGYTEPMLADLWRRAGLSAAEQEILNNPTRREVKPDAIVFTPSPGLVVGLSPAARGTIYSALAAFPENAPQFGPYRLRADAVPHWFDDSGLPAATVALTRRLFYRRGTDAVFFSDDDLVLPTLQSAGERVKFIKTLSRKSALFVHLRVPPRADTEGIARYWGHGRRAKDLRPLLQSLARRPAGGALDLVHLLPGLPRSLLYTYPLPADPAAPGNRDCHWTSFNFFNEQADERFARIDEVRHALLADYYAVPGEPTFGDILMFLQPGGVVVHSCVYLADDLVFTKNGVHFSVPWQISTLASVKAFYSLNTPTLEVRRYRLNNR